MLPTNAPSILTCALRLPPASTTAMSIGCPISSAFRAAPSMTRCASSSVMVSFVFAASAIISLSRRFLSMLALEPLRRDLAQNICWHDLRYTCSIFLPSWYPADASPIPAWARLFNHDLLLLSTSGRVSRRPDFALKFARVPQTSFGFGTDAPYKFTGGGNVRDQVNPFPGPDHRRIEVSAPHRGSERRDLLIQRRAKVFFPSVPTFHKAVAYSATGERLRPLMLAHDVEDPRSLCVATLGSHYALLGTFVAQRFGGRIEASPHQCSLCAKHERRRQAAPVGDAASGQRRRRRRRVDHRGYQRQSRPVRAVPAGFRPLRDDDVRACCPGGAPVFHVLDLADQRATCLLDGRDKRTWITKREHESVWLVAQGKIKDLPRSVPSDQSYAPGTLRLAPGCREFGAQPSGVAVTAAHKPQRASVRYRRGQVASSNATHGS